MDFLGVGLFSGFRMETNEPAQEAQLGPKSLKTGAAIGELKPKDAVRRILTAAGVELPDKEAFWLGYHMERFVNHTRKHGELLEFPVAVESYIAFFKQGSPADWQVEQLKQALVLFGRSGVGRVKALRATR